MGRGLKGFIWVPSREAHLSRKGRRSLRRGHRVNSIQTEEEADQGEKQSKAREVAGQRADTLDSQYECGLLATN